MSNRAKEGDTIAWTFGSEKYTPTSLIGKTFTAEVAIVDLEEGHYCVMAEYGPDYIPFEDATIINKINNMDYDAWKLSPPPEEEEEEEFSDEKYEQQKDEEI